MIARCIALLVPVFVTNACASYSLVQTAHTTPPRHVRINTGLVHVNNENTGTAGRPWMAHTAVELSGRYGVSRQLDVGVSPFFMGLGATADAKLNVIPTENAFALAPRLRLGGGTWNESRDYLVDGSLVGSYRLGRVVEPYGALGYATHFIKYATDSASLEPNQTLAERAGTGDGIIEAIVGMSFTLTPHFSLCGEYQYWHPGHNDLGDGYAFVGNHIFAGSASWQLP